MAPAADGATGLVRDASDAAARAADVAGVEVTDLHARDELAGAADLFDAVWGRAAAAGRVLSPEALIAMAHAGCQLSGARRDGRLVGATAAFLGRDSEGGLRLHSHVTGVVTAARGAGVGWALKLHQRAWALGRDIDVVEWTFDPLVRRNAVFNLVRLGARPVAYLDDVYGPMDDTLNAGLPTDRFVVRWQLAEARVVAAASGRAAEPRIDALRRSGALELLSVGGDGEPVVGTAGGPRLLARIPDDVEALRTEDPRRAAAWARAVRETVGRAIADGYRVTGISHDGWYVLVAPAGTEELSDVGGMS